MPLAAAVHEIACNGVAWARISLMNTTPWWPVFVADPLLSTDELMALGGNELVDATKSKTHNQVAVFYFGLRTWHLRQSDGEIQMWQCPDHKQYIQGFPSAAMDVPSVWDHFVQAMDDVENFLSSEHDKRALPRPIATVAKESVPATVPTDTPTQAPFESVAWTELAGRPWLPVFIVNPSNIPTELRHLSQHQGQLVQDAIARPRDLRLVYYFGYHNFGLIPVATIKAWNGPEHEKFLAGCPSDQAAVFKAAIAEAQSYVESDPLARKLEHTLKSEQSLDVSSQKSTSPTEEFATAPTTMDLTDRNNHAAVESTVECNSLAWAKLDPVQPWWPVFVCDPFKLRRDLDILGSKHVEKLESAMQNPTDRKLVYYLGKYTFGLVKAEDEIKPWNCPERDSFLLGPPDMSIVEGFQNAVKEAQEIEGKAARLPPFLKPSDVDSSIPTTPGPFVTVGSVVWALEDVSWMPGYVCDLDDVQATHLPDDHADSAAKALAVAKETPGDAEVVYLFGENTFVAKNRRTQLKPWNSSEHDLFVKGLPFMMEYSLLAKVEVATKLAQEFANLDQTTRRPPFHQLKSSQPSVEDAPPSDTSSPSSDSIAKEKPAPSPSSAENYVKSTPKAETLPVKSESGALSDTAQGVTAPPSSSHNSAHERPAPSDMTEPATAFGFGSVVWTSTTGDGWVPAYVCDPTQVKSTVPHLSAWHKKLLATAIEHPQDYAVVYLFGSRTLGLRKQKDAVMKQWGCPEHASYLQGVDDALDFSNQRKIAFQNAVDAAQAVAAQGTKQALPFTQLNGNGSDDGKDTSEKNGTSPEDSSPLSDAIHPADSTIPPPFAPPASDGRQVPTQTIPPLEKPNVESTSNIPRPAEVASISRDTANASLADTNENAKKRRHSFDIELPHADHKDASAPTHVRRKLNPELGGAPTKPEISSKSMVWVKCATGYTWWPAYVCDPDETPHQLHSMGYCLFHNVQMAKQFRKELRFVFFLGRHTFGLSEVASDLKRWKCPEHAVLTSVHENPLPRQIMAAKLFAIALKEAQEFAATATAATPPPFTNHNAIKTAIIRPPKTMPYECKAWALTTSSVWFPAFVCHPMALPRELLDWTVQRQDWIELVQQRSCEYRLAFIFGPNQLGCLDVKTELVPWEAGNPNIAKAPKDLVFAKKYIDQADKLSAAQLDIDKYLGADTKTRRLPVPATADVHVDFFQVLSTSPTNATEASPPSPVLSAPVDPSPPVLTPVERTEAPSQVVEPSHIASTPNATEEQPVELGELGWVNSPMETAAWPVYVCDPNRCHINLGFPDAQMLHEAKASPFKKRLVYYFGFKKFGVVAVKSIARWNCRDRAVLSDRFLKVQGRDSGARILREAEEFAGANMSSQAVSPVASSGETTDRSMPHTVESGQNPHVEPPPLRLVWRKREDSVWVPGLVYDPTNWPDEFGLPPGKMYAFLKTLPGAYVPVYNFGSGTFSAAEAKGNCLVAWRSPMHEQFVAHILALTNLSDKTKLLAALKEIQAFEKQEQLDGDGAEETPAEATAVVAPSAPSNRPSSTQATESRCYAEDFNCVGWGKQPKLPWWPVYICDPENIPRQFISQLASKQQLYQPLNMARKDPTMRRLVYYFGVNSFGSLRLAGIKPWQCREKSTFSSDMYIKLDLKHVFNVAVEEAEKYHANQSSPPTQTVASGATPTTDASRGPQPSNAANAPQTVPQAGGTQPTYQTVPPPRAIRRPNPVAAGATQNQNEVLPCHSVAWGILRGFPWLPVYILDAHTLSPHLHYLGDGHVSILEEARENPSFRIVYYFGTHDFGIHKQPTATLRPWNCAEHDEFIHGFPKERCKKQRVRVELGIAVKEAREFLSASPDERLLPHMLRSDYLDPNAEDWSSSEDFIEEAPADDVSSSEMIETSSGDSDSDEDDPDEESDVEEYSHEERHTGPVWPMNKRRRTHHTWKNMVKLQRNPGTHEWALVGRPYRRPKAPDSSSAPNAAPSSVQTTQQDNDGNAETTDPPSVPRRNTISNLLAESSPDAAQRPHAPRNVSANPLLPQRGVAWALLQESKWWPVLVCGSTVIANQNGDRARVVQLYYFGRQNYGQHFAAKMQLQVWNCPNHDDIRRNPGNVDQPEFARAVAEAQDFFLTYKATLERDALMASLKCLQVPKAQSSPTLNEHDHAPSGGKGPPSAENVVYVQPNLDVVDPELDEFFR